MNTSLKPIVLGSLGLAMGALLPSCVAPYPAGPGQVTATTTIGYQVRTLPPGYRTEIVGGTRYYIHDSTYYRPRSGGYVVVDAPRGYRPAPKRVVYVDHLPRGYRVVRYGGREYYQVQNRYYQRSGTRYIIVDRPR